MNQLQARLLDLKQKGFFALITLIAVGFVVHFCVYISPSIRDALPAEASLSGEWQLCLPASPSEQGCRWTTELVPSEKPARPLDDFMGWMLYRKTFTAPESCLSQTEPCAFFAGEVDDAVEARLNGVAIGRHGGFPPNTVYSKHYPVKFSLSGDLLKKGEGANELLLTVYSMKKTQSGIRRGPLGIYSEANAFKLAQSFVAMTVFVPIVGFVGLFLIALFTSFFNLTNAVTGDDRLQSYVSYCFVNAIFLLSFSEVPREYLPIWLAGYLHFAFRFLASWTYFEMICAYYRFGPWCKKYVRPLYMLTFGTFIALFCVQYFSGSIERGGAGFDMALLTLQKAVPLLWAPHFFGIAGAYLSRPSKSRRFFIAFFTVILACQIHDTLIFHGYTSGTYACKIYPLIVGLCFGAVIWFEQQRERERLLVARENAAHAAQVAHDIRSPLAALDVAAGDAAHLPEESRILIRSAVSRIRDIANNLLEQHRAMESAPASSWLLSSLIDPILSEKRLQYRSAIGVRIDSSMGEVSYGLFARVQPAEFQRVVSNLLNNAVEALAQNKGEVTVALSAREGWVHAAVADNGKGIPSELLAELGRQGGTFGKVDGSGLGLRHARAAAEAWGGRLEIASAAGKGTTVTLLIPQAPAPSWFVAELELVPGKTVVILDDDVSIHQVWQRRLAAALAPEHGIKIVHFSTPAEIQKWFKDEAPTAREALYLVDHELLGYRDTGLGLAEELGFGARAILVTSRSEDPAIRGQCLRLKARMIPKGLAGLVPIRVAARPTAVEAVSGEPELLDAVLIDDDPLVRMTWELSASRSKAKFKAYATAEEFLAGCARLDGRTPVYIDEELSGGLKGLAESVKISARGFTEIYLSTGHEAESLADLGPPIRGVVGKNSPWP